MTMALIAISLIGIACTCLAALGAKILREFSRHDLEEICERRNAVSRLRDILHNYEDAAMAAEGLQTLATTTTLVAATLWLAVGPVDIAPTLLAVGGGALLLGAITVWIPWAVVELGAEAFLYHTWPLWRALGRFMTPWVWCAQLANRIARRLAGRNGEVDEEDAFEDEIRTIVSEGHREGLLEEDAREMIEGVIEMADADVAEIMTPRSRMMAIQVDTAWPEVIKVVLELPHTRVPVYDRDLDDIIGTLHTKDLLPILAGGDGHSRPPLRTILRGAIFVPESKAIDDLLEQFQQTRNHIAIAIDEYNRVSGLVTIEDVLEEIVGEIVDEHDLDAVAEIVRIDHDTCEALGRAHLDEINDELSLRLPENAEFDTIGGLVLDFLGRVPEVGQQVEWENVRITVLEASRRGVDRVRIEVPGSQRRETA